MQRTGEGWIKVREDARVRVDGGVAIAPNARATTALTDVFGFGRILAVLCAHRVAHPTPRRKLGEVGFGFGLAQHTALHHLPQQHTNTAENV